MYLDVKSLVDQPPPSFQRLCLSRKTKLGKIIPAHVALSLSAPPHSPSQACGEIQEGVDDVSWLLIQRATLLCCFMSMPCLIGEQSGNLTSSALIPAVPPTQQWANQWMECFGDSLYRRKILHHRISENTSGNTLRKWIKNSYFVTYLLLM